MNTNNNNIKKISPLGNLSIAYKALKELTNAISWKEFQKDATNIC